MRTFLTRARAFSQRISQAMRIVWRVSPQWTLVNVFMVVVQGVLPLISLYLLKRIVDSVTPGSPMSRTNGGLPPVVLWILLAGGVALIAAVCRSLAELSGEAQAQLVTDAVSDVIHEQSAAVDLAYYEDSRYFNTLHMAQAEAPSRPMSIVANLIQVSQSAISLLGIVWLLVLYNWVLTLLVFLVAVPGALVRLRYARKLHTLRERQTEQDRRAWYYHWLLTLSMYAKEVRLFDLGSLFRQRYRDLRRDLRENRLSLSRHRVVLELLAQTLATVGIFGALLYVAISALRGVLTPGEMVLYYQGFQNGFAYLQSALSAGAGLYENSLFLHNYQEFLDLRPSVLPLPPVHAVPQPEEQTIRFHGVSYWYPNSVSPALQDVDLEIGAARVIALVGENGSGKSTLVKLLSRLHDPTSGIITVDGCDLRHLDPKAWRRLVSIIFQDYACYLLSAGENIWLGNVEHPFDLQAVRRAAQASGSDAMISRLPSQYDTLLGNAFADGQELSIGEWQKIAVARAFMRDAGIVVLDEPSSALDPLAEAELFRRFRSLIHGRSAILISHRFSTVQLADYIYVLEKGRIIEHGTHLDLVRAGGTYARMYRAQAQHYQGPLPV